MGGEADEVVPRKLTISTGVPDDEADQTNSFLEMTIATGFFGGDGFHLDAMLLAFFLLRFGELLEVSRPFHLQIVMHFRDFFASSR